MPNYREPRLSCLLSLFVLTFLPSQMQGECLEFADAGKHIGEIHCVRGRVLNVAVGDRGVHYLEFCQDHESCPFTVVIFAHDLKDVGDVRQLTGNQIEIHGAIKEYDGRAEIILERPRQLGQGMTLPPIPKAYDVENRGHYSAGKFSRPRAPRKVYKKKPPTTLPTDISADSSD